MEPMRDDAKPLYIQVAEEIRKDIQAGRIPLGSPIGSQMGLKQQYNVSRVTLRHAIKILEREGLVTTRQGKGSYATSTGLSQELGDLLSLGEIVEAHGLHHEVSIADFRWVVAPEQVAAFYGIQSETPVLRVKRQHIVNGLPIALALIYVPAEVGVAITRRDLETEPLYTVMERKLHLRLGRAVQEIQAVAADSQTAGLLKVASGCPLLVAQRRTFSEDGNPIEHITFYYRSDFYRFTVNLQRAKTLSMVVPPFPKQAASAAEQEGGNAYVAASLQLSKDPGASKAT